MPINVTGNSIGTRARLLSTAKETISRQAREKGNVEREDFRRCSVMPWWGYYSESLYVPWRVWWGADKGWQGSSAVWAGSPSVSPDAESPWCRKCFVRGRRCARSAAQKSPLHRFAASGTLKSNTTLRYVHGYVHLYTMLFARSSFAQIASIFIKRSLLLEKCNVASMWIMTQV